MVPLPEGIRRLVRPSRNHPTVAPPRGRLGRARRGARPAPPNLPLGSPFALTCTTPFFVGEEPIVTLIPWSNDLSVGVKAVDDQHMELVAMVNELHTAMADGRGQQALGPLFDRLIAYTQHHFSDEEALMERHACPELDRHRELHRLLVEHVQALRGKFEDGTILLSVELMAFLKDWLVTHIQVEDAQCCAYLTSKGVR
jgi:hemerythrin